MPTPQPERASAGWPTDPAFSRHPKPPAFSPQVLGGQSDTSARRNRRSGLNRPAAVCQWAIGDRSRRTASRPGGLLRPTSLSSISAQSAGSRSSTALRAAPGRAPASIAAGSIQCHRQQSRPGHSYAGSLRAMHHFSNAVLDFAPIANCAMHNLPRHTSYGSPRRRHVHRKNGFGRPDGRGRGRYVIATRGEYLPKRRLTAKLLAEWRPSQHRLSLAVLISCRVGCHAGAATGAHRRGRSLLQIVRV